MQTSLIRYIPPPYTLYKRVQEKFGAAANWDKGTVFTYDGHIYTKNRLDRPLELHEMHHIKQQTEYPGGTEAWWDRYLTDDDFRLSQEIEAYRIQYKAASKMIKDRNDLYWYLVELARVVSGPMYGNMISTSDAIKRIRN